MLEQVSNGEIQEQNISDGELIRLGYALKYMDKPYTEHSEYWKKTKPILIERLKKLFPKSNTDYGFKICNGLE
jgi:hypothetical protein